MNKYKLYRGNVEGYPINTDTKTDKLIQNILDKTTQIASNKSDEVAIMHSMLNDDDFEIAIFDSNKGYIGSHSPRREALDQIADSLTYITGMTLAEAKSLVKGYQFSKREAIRYVELAKDFYSTYLQTGRKITITNADARSEIVINLKDVDGGDKQIPIKGANATKTVHTRDSIRLISDTRRIKK